MVLYLGVLEAYVCSVINKNRKTSAMKKYFATFKYLFFPFLMANSTGSDFTKAFHHQETIRINVESANFQYPGVDAGFWKIDTETQATEQQANPIYLLAISEMEGGYTGNKTNKAITPNREFLMPYKYELTNQ
jgi:hypothetical protein